MIPAQVLNDLVCAAQRDYDSAIGYLIATRDKPLPESDPTAAGARDLAVELLERLCQVYESRLEQVESIARGAEADERERLHAENRARYEEVAAWKQYATDAETAFQDAALHEMEQADLADGAA